jgi:hypothetical protein
MDDGQSFPSDNDVLFFRKLAAHVRSNPVFYKDAGQWLDREFSDKALRRRAREKMRTFQRRRESGERLLVWEERLLDDLENRRGANRKTFLPLLRFHEAMRTLLDSTSYRLTTFEAKCILLLTWLMTDPHAEAANLGLTAFESWPWRHSEARDEADPRNREYAMEFLLDPRTKSGKHWMPLARRAWAEAVEGIKGPKPKGRPGRPGKDGQPCCTPTQVPASRSVSPTA